MATVIDELIVKLGLDPKDFEKGQKEAANSFLKTRDAARKTGKDIEDVGKKTGAEIEKFTRKIIALFATIQGSRGLRDLVTGLTQANAELGRFGANIGVAPQRLAAWGAAVQKVGGDASQAQGTIGKLASGLQQFRLGMGNLPDALFQLMGRTGVQVNTTGSTEQYINGIAEAVQKLAKTDRQSAFNLAQSLGIDEATFEVMRKYGAGLNEYLATLEKVGPSQKAIDAAQKMQEAWAGLVQTLTEVSQKLYEVAAPQITKLIEALTRMFERLAKDVDWNAIGNGLKTFADAAGAAIDHVDGLTAATAALFALWTGAKFASALANLTLLKGGIGGAKPPGAPVASGGFWGPAMAALAVVATLGRGSVIRDPKYAKMLQDQLNAGTHPSTPQPDYGGLTRDPGAHGERLMGDVKVDGRSVNKGNPLPVQIAGGNTGSGGGFWSSLGSAIGNFFAPDANASQGGGGGGGGNGGGGGDKKPSATAVPNIEGMTSEEKNFLGLVLQHESAGKNTMNYMGKSQGIDPEQAKGYTAQGYYQILNSNWRRLAPKLGIKARNAMAASLEDQTKVALALLRESGQGNWTNWNPSLRRAVMRGDNAGSWGGMVPEGTPSGAQVSALSNSISNDNRRSSIMNSSDTRIGNVNVYAQGPADGASLADQMWNSLMRRTGQTSTAAAANTGPL